MKYTCGRQISIGDWIWCNEGVSVGVVSLILEEEEQWQEWGLMEPGVFVSFDLSCHTLTQDQFVSEESFEQEGVAPLDQVEKQELQQLHHRICSINATVEKKSYSVRRRKPGFGIPWIFYIEPANPERALFYGFIDGETLKKLSKDEAFR